MERTGDRSGDTTGKAALRTLWSQTLIETLYDAIQNEWSNNALEVIIKELYNKGYSQEKLMAMVEKKLGKPATLRIIRIILNQ